MHRCSIRQSLPTPLAGRAGDEAIRQSDDAMRLRRPGATSRWSGRVDREAIPARTGGVGTEDDWGEALGERGRWRAHSAIAGRASDVSRCSRQPHVPGEQSPVSEGAGPRMYIKAIPLGVRVDAPGRGEGITTYWRAMSLPLIDRSSWGSGCCRYRSAPVRHAQSD